MAKRQDGIRTLECIRGRCRIDEETGCWVWAYGRNDKGYPVCAVSAGVFKPTRVIMPPLRAAFMLAGNHVPEGHEVYRKVCCHNPLCVNPAHARSGGKGGKNTAAAARGVYSTPKRLWHLTMARGKQAISREAYQIARDAVDSGASYTEAAKRAGICRDTASVIARRMHYYDTLGMPRAASVFMWRPS